MQQLTRIRPFCALLFLPMHVGRFMLFCALLLPMAGASIYSLLFCALLLPMAGASIYSLQDVGRPMLSSPDGQPLAWWEGGPAFALASLGAVRVNFRGLYTYPHTSIVRDLKALGWNKAVCNVSAWAMCASDVGQAFPWRSPRLPEQVETVNGWNALSCANSQHKVLVSLGVYDISACDVLDEGLDVVYASGELFHRYSTMDVWEYWVFVVLSIVLVRFFSYNIQVLWEPPGTQDATKPQWQALVCCLVVIGVVLSDGDSHFVTSADHVFYWSNVLYISVYLLLHFVRLFLARTKQKKDAHAKQQEKQNKDAHAKQQEPHADVPVYNIIIGTLQLIACRFYASAETPYNLVLMGILATRAWCVFFSGWVLKYFKIVLDEPSSHPPPHPQ